MRSLPSWSIPCCSVQPSTAATAAALGCGAAATNAMAAASMQLVKGVVAVVVWFGVWVVLRAGVCV